MKQGAPQLPGLPQYQQLPTNTELFAKTAGTIAGGVMQQNAQDSYMSNLKDIAKIQAGGAGQGGGQTPMYQRQGSGGTYFSQKPPILPPGWGG
jgi:hypothetical protein